MTKLTLRQIRAARLAGSGLLKPFPSPEEAAKTLFGIQAQIHSAGAVSLFNRTRGLTLAEAERRLFDGKTLIKLWGQRGTLHFYRTEDWALLASAYSGRPSWTERYYIKCGGTAEEYADTLRRVCAVLGRNGTATRNDVRHLLTKNSHLSSSWGGIFFDLVRRGEACHARSDGPQGVFASRKLWLGDRPWKTVAEPDAQKEITLRYFTAYGPATVQDFAYWRGVPLSRARKYAATLGELLKEVPTELGPMLVLRKAKTETRLPPPQLLYRFDPVLLGHKDKSWLVPPEFKKRVIRPAGHIEGIAVSEGEARATWRYDKTPKGLVITLRPFGEKKAADFDGFRKRAEAIAAFFGLPLADFRVLRK